MPAPLTIPADRRSLAVDGLVYRTCSRCGSERPLNPANFFHRNNGWIDARCQDCRRAVDAQNRVARRNGAGQRTGRKFGVEIEFIGSGRAVADAMRALGLTCNVEGYNHRVRRNAWKIVPDGSVSRGMELVSPPLSGSAGQTALRKACQALHAAGATINSACGLHVHHDITDLNAAAIGKLARTWHDQQRNINGLVARSRRDSQWARPFRASEIEGLETLPADHTGERLQRSVQMLYIDRYRALNFSSFPRYGTVEVRQHQGTTNASKILAWIEFGQALIRSAKSTDAVTPIDTPSLVDALRSHGLKDSTAEFLQERARYFAGTRRTAVAA